MEVDKEGTSSSNIKAVAASAPASRQASNVEAISDKPKTTTLGRSRKKKAAPPPPTTTIVERKNSSESGSCTSSIKSASSGKKAKKAKPPSVTTNPSPASEEFLAFKVRVSWDLDLILGTILS